MSLSTPGRARVALPTLLLLASLAPGASAQLGSDRLLLLPDQAQANFAYALCVVGDVDLDGRADYAVGAYLHDAGGTNAGRVSVHSGLDGDVLATFDGLAPGDEFGFTLAAAGDVDGDGRADLVVGTRSGRYVQVLPGQGGAPLHHLAARSPEDLFGLAVAGLGDLDGDGRPDFAVGAPGATGSLRGEGLVQVFSGASGASLLSVYGEISGYGFGRSLAGAGRVDADLVPDFLAGGNSGSNVVRVVSGASGSTIHLLVGDFALDWFGTSLCGLGDLDGDGRADFAVGAPQSFLGAGYVRIYSGLDASLIRQHLGSALLDSFGWSLSTAGDVDHDGRQDLLVGAPFADPFGRFNAGRASVWSGASGALLLEIAGALEEDGLGWSVAGRLCADPILGAPTAGSGGLARVIETEQGALPERTCSANPNSTGQAAAMGWLGTTSVQANDLVLTTSGCPPGAIGIYFWAPTSGLTPFGNGFNCTSGAVVRLGNTNASPAGVAQRALDLFALAPAQRPVPGQLRYAQFWYRNPAGGGAGFNLSDALRLPFCE